MSGKPMSIRLDADTVARVDATAKHLQRATGLAVTRSEAIRWLLRKKPEATVWPTTCENCNGDGEIEAGVECPTCLGEGNILR